MRVDDIEIHEGEPDRDYTYITAIEGVARKAMFAHRPTFDDVNGYLRQRAVEVGANAVIKVQYRREGRNPYRAVILTRDICSQSVTPCQRMDTARRREQATRCPAAPTT